MCVSGILRAILPDRVKNSLKSHLGVPSVEASLRNLKRLGFRPETIIDVGAYCGEWTALSKSIWPSASVLMVEASPNRMEALRDFAKTMANVTALQALLGPSAKPSVPFYEQESASSALPENAKSAQPFDLLPMRTLDDVVEGTRFARPDFLKLDVQGLELGVLEGGRGALRSSQAVLLEVNLMELYRGAPLLDQAVRFMADEGMLAYDICTFHRRPFDGALWQIDMLFVRRDSRLRASVQYE